MNKFLIFGHEHILDIIRLETTTKRDLNNPEKKESSFLNEKAFEKQKGRLEINP